MKKNRPFPTSSRGQVSASVYEDYRLEQTDNSPSIGAREKTALFKNSKTVNCQTKFFCLRVTISEVSLMAAAQQVFMFVFSLCNLMELKHYFRL